MRGVNTRDANMRDANTRDANIYRAEGQLTRALDFPLFFGYYAFSQDWSYGELAQLVER